MISFVTLVGVDAPDVTEIFLISFKPRWINVLNTFDAEKLLMIFRAQKQTQLVRVRRKCIANDDA